jgi:hypothetical protein
MRLKTWFIGPLVTLSLTSHTTAAPVELTIHTDQTTKTVSVGIYGQFLEHITSKSNTHENESATACIGRIAPVFRLRPRPEG